MADHDFTERAESVHTVSIGFPAPDDWDGWVDVWCREDTGNIDCVPGCLRHHVQDMVREDGWLKNPDTLPNTPYKIARWFQSAPGNAVPPWSGSGLSPLQVKYLWGNAKEEAAAKAAEEAAASVVEYADLYFITSKGGPIKIGVSNNPAKRLKGLQTSNPYQLTLSAVIPGGALMEGEYHKRFAEHRLVGEWFNPAPDILAEIDRLNQAPIFAIDVSEAAV